MALRLTLKADERIIAGGAVLRNATGRSVELLVENEVPLLREKDIMTNSQADSPCKRVYLAVQLMYIDGENLAKYQGIYWELAREVFKAAPSTAALFHEISEAVSQGRYYQALKGARKLVQHEEKVLRNAPKPARRV